MSGIAAQGHALVDHTLAALAAANSRALLPSDEMAELLYSIVATVSRAEPAFAHAQLTDAALRKIAACAGMGFRESPMPTGGAAFRVPSGDPALPMSLVLRPDLPEVVRVCAVLDNTAMLLLPGLDFVNHPVIAGAFVVFGLHGHYDTEDEFNAAMLALVRATRGVGALGVWFGQLGPAELERVNDVIAHYRGDAEREWEALCASRGDEAQGDAVAAG